MLIEKVINNLVQKLVFVCTSVALTCVITLKWNRVGC